MKERRCKVVHVNDLNYKCFDLSCVSGQHAAWSLGSDIRTHHSVSSHLIYLEYLVVLRITYYQCELIFDWWFCLSSALLPAPRAPWPWRQAMPSTSLCQSMKWSSLTSAYTEPWPFTSITQTHIWLVWSCELSLTWATHFNHYKLDMHSIQQKREAVWTGQALYRPPFCTNQHAELHNQLSNHIPAL